MTNHDVIWWFILPQISYRNIVQPQVYYTKGIAIMNKDIPIYLVCLGNYVVKVTYQTVQFYVLRNKTRNSQFKP